MKLKLTILSFMIVILAGSIVWIRKVKQTKIQSMSSTTSLASQSSTLQQSNTPTPIPSNSPTQPAIVYPISRYNERITNRWYGKAITAADRQSLPCGAAFHGFHTGDDLEVTSDELNQEVPVFAITDGIVRQVGTVGGYGGLLVIQYNLDGQTVTAYYGHINLSKTVVKKGDIVKPGQKVSILGDNCSSQTAGERKHLHFAIHKGSLIDVRGYVQTESELQSWLNPKEIVPLPQ